MSVSTTRNIVLTAAGAAFLVVALSWYGCSGKCGVRCFARGETVSGGARADGKDLYRVELTVLEGSERITIHINEAKWDPADKPVPAEVIPHYTITYEEYPARLVCMFDGIRMYSAVLPGCEGSSLVGPLERMMILDDQAVAFAAELKRCSSFTVTEMTDPARVVIEIVPATGCPDERVWSLRSSGVMRGETIGHFQEKLGHLGGAGAPRELHGAGGAIVEEGIYPTREEAEKRKAALSGQGIEMMIEERGMFDRPEIREEQDGR